jgi:hypothetical protein
MGESPPGGSMRRWRPNGLVARLAALDGKLGAGAAGIARKPWASKPFPLVPFVFGLSASLLFGAAAARFLAMMPPVGAAEHALAALGEAAAAPPARLQLEILRSDQPSALPLLVTGLEDTAAARVVLRNLPEALWFSRGERRDEHTWDLAGTDLDELGVTLRAGTPQAFTLDIEVVAADAVLLAHSAASVRVIDAPSEARNAPVPRGLQKLAASPAGGGISAAKADEAGFKRQAGTPAPPVLAREAGTRAGVPAPEQSRPLAEDPARRPASAPSVPAQRPAGMSALGALSREPEAEGRWLWWRLPVLAWPTLKNGEGARR